MEFVVRFRSKEQYAVDLPNRGVGLKYLLYVREKLGLEIPEERVNSYIVNIHRNPEVVIPSSRILSDDRLKELFYDKQKVVVGVPQGSLNKYSTISLKVDKDEATGEVKYVNLYFDLTEDNEEKILEDWIAAGCPLEWDPNNQDEMEEKENEEDEDEDYEDEEEE